MIKIKSFEIQAYRSIKKSKINFNSEFTALIGVNGSGKSNILNAILLLKKTFQSRYRLYPLLKTNAKNKSKIRVELSYNGKSVILYGEIYFESEERNFDEIIGTKIKWDFSNLFEGANNIELPNDFYYYSRDPEVVRFDASKIISFFNSSHSVNDIKIDKKQITILEQTLPHIRRILDFFASTNYYSASQFSDPSKCPNYLELDEDRPFRTRRYDGGHERFIMDLYQTWSEREKDSKYNNYINIVNSSGIGLLDDISFTEFPRPTNSYEVLSGGQVKTIEKKRKLIVPTFKIDQNKLSPNQLSEGTLRALALIYYILTDESKLLLVEEPEVCVHHGLLNSIIALLKTQTQKKQIIISTHSDYVLDHLSPENVVLVRKDFTHGTTAELLTDTLKKDDFKALKEYLEKSGNLGEYWKEGGLE